MRPAEMRAKANECFEQSRRADWTTKLIYTQAAQQWRNMADQMELLTDQMELLEREPTYRMIRRRPE